MRAVATTTLGLLAMTLAQIALAMFAPCTFQEAYQYGADAKIEFKVVDDLGLPVAEAKVNVFFDMADRSKARRVIRTTDTNGVCVAEAKTKGVMEIEVSRDGYYSSKAEISFIDMGREHEVKEGKWQPWEYKKEIVLRMVRNPKARRVHIGDWRRTAALNEWIGFDLEECDYVAPIGKGKIVDVDVKFDWDGTYAAKHNGMAVNLRFNEKFSGGYYESRAEYSAFTGVYMANTNQTFNQQFCYYRRPVRDAGGRIVGVDGKGFDQTKALVVRSRCVVDEKGELVSARYFQIENFDFSCTSDKNASIIFNLTYNPTPNDPNLEPK